MIIFILTADRTVPNSNQISVNKFNTDFILLFLIGIFSWTSWLTYEFVACHVFKKIFVWTLS